jgi:hypothetical protein
MVQLVLNYLIVFVALAAIYLGCRATFELAQDLLNERANNRTDRSPQIMETYSSASALPDGDNLLPPLSTTTQDEADRLDEVKIGRTNGQQRA